MEQFARKYGTFFVFFAAMLWASDAPFRAHLTKELSSNFIVLGEHVVDMLVALPVLWHWRAELAKLSGREWFAIFFIGICGSALASIAFTQAFHYVSPSVAILLQKLQPLLTIALAVTFLHERLPKNFWWWFSCAICGAYLVSFSGLKPELFPGEHLTANQIGVLYALLAAVCWGASTVCGKIALERVNFQTVTALRFVVASFFLGGLNMYTGTWMDYMKMSTNDVYFIAMTAITSGIVALFIYYRGLMYTKASVATIAELGFPVAAVLVNYFFLNSTLSIWQIVGMVLLIVSVGFLSQKNETTVPVPQQA